MENGNGTNLLGLVGLGSCFALGAEFLNKKEKGEKERKRERERSNAKLVKIDLIRCAASEPPMIDTDHRQLVYAHTTPWARKYRREITHGCSMGLK